MSSTAIVLQSLAERRKLKTSGGQAVFSVLLFQDVAVIPILALLPVLATDGAAASHGDSALSNLPAWQQAFIVFAAVALILHAIAAGMAKRRHRFNFKAEFGKDGAIDQTTIGALAVAALAGFFVGQRGKRT